MYDIKITFFCAQKVCDKCRKKISELDLDPGSQSSHSSLSDSTECNVITDVVVDSLNNSLRVLGETPIKKKRLSEKNYPKTKIEKLSFAIKRKLNVSPEKKRSKHI